MKNFIKKSVLSALVLSFIVASCSKDNSVATNRNIQKRKYSSGFHFETAKRLKKVSIEQEKNQQQTTLLEPKYSIIEDETEINDNQSIESELKTDLRNDLHVEANIRDDNYAEKSITKVEKETIHTRIKNDQREYLEKAKNQEIKNKPIAIQQLKKAKIQNQDSNYDSIVYVLLCIFLPFVAVGLATDWDVEKVVIALLLSLTCIGGIIYAFYICDKQGVLS